MATDVASTGENHYDGPGCERFKTRPPADRRSRNFGQQECPPDCSDGNTNAGSGSMVNGSRLFQRQRSFQPTVTVSRRDVVTDHATAIDRTLNFGVLIEESSIPDAEPPVMNAAAHRIALDHRAASISSLTAFSNSASPPNSIPTARSLSVTI